jgi:hypothetical protein
VKQAGKALQQLELASRVPADIRNSVSYKRFTDAINNPQTAEKYHEMFAWFVEYTGDKKEKDLLSISDEKVEDKIISYIRHLKDDGIKPTTIRTRLAPLILYYEMNRKRLAWKMIKRTIPKGNGKAKDRGYTRAEIQKMMSAANPREQALVSLFASTGMRRGAPPLLRMRHLIPLKYGIYEIIVYEGEAEEYHTYTTPEARSEIEAYLAFREQYGEKLTLESFVFRKDWNLRNRKAAENPIPITEKTITTALSELAKKSGVRVKQHIGHRRDSNAVDVGKKAGRVRHAQKIVHGLRKYFETALLDVGFSENWLDMIEGHKLKGLRDNYYRPKDNTVLLGTTTADGKIHLPGFLEVMGELTISDEQRLQTKVTQLEVEKETEIASLKEMLITTNDSVIQLRDELNRLKGSGN